MIGFYRVEKLIGVSLGLLSLGAFVSISSPVKAQVPECYMVTQTGQFINLSSLCGVEPTSATPQNNAATRQQSQSNQLQTSPNGQNVSQPVQQSFTQQGNFNGQGPGAYSRTAGGLRLNQAQGGASPVSGQWQPVLDSAALRTEPGTGSLIQQLRDGDRVRVYDELRSNNSVFVETSDGQRGWVNTWNLPGFGVSY